MKHEDLICGDRVYVNGGGDLFTVTAMIHCDTHSSITIRAKGVPARSLNPHDTIEPGQMLPRVELTGDRVQDLRPGDVWLFEDEEHAVALVKVGRLFTEVHTRAGRTLRLVTGHEIAPPFGPKNIAKLKRLARKVLDGERSPWVNWDSEYDPECGSGFEYKSGKVYRKYWSAFPPSVDSIYCERRTAVLHELVKMLEADNEEVE